MLTHRLHRLLVLSTGLRDCGIEQRLAMIRERRYPPLLRVAAPRCLVHWAPLDVTRDAPYPQRRRHVRRHYGV